ncbi:MAG: ABC transporter transmembrane domain-containing protein [Bacteroidota bacterium]
MAKKRIKDNEDMPKAKINKASLQKTLRVFKFMGPHKWKFFIGLIFLAFTGVTSLLFPYLMKGMFDASGISAEKINQFGIYLIILFFAQSVFSYFRVVLFVSFTENMIAGLRKATYSQLIKMPFHYFASNRVGEINSRMSADIAQIQDSFTVNLAEFLRQFMIIIFGIALLFYTSVDLAILMLATIPVIAIVAILFGKYIRKLSKTVQDNVAESNVIIEETMQGFSSVKSFTNELFEIKRYSEKITEIKNLAIKGGKARGAFISFIIFCSFSAIIILIWKAVQLQRMGEISQGDLVQFLLYSIFVGASIGGIAEQYSQIQKAIGATERIMDILDDKPEDIDTTKDFESVKLDGKIEFKNIEFSYPSRKENIVLKNVSFEVSKGKVIAIVGPSGSGKSTITALLQRFYEPNNGNISVDDKPITDYSLRQLRSNIAIVPQDVLLFGGSIKENIAYGKTNATLEEIIEAAKKANAHDFIESFPEKYDTIVGDRGIKLSGGQRQRVAIARAVLKNPSVLILDEATSSLDSESERIVQEALEKLMKGRTSIVIAHRLSTVRYADKIVVLNKGVIEEQGSHEELMQLENGLYKKLNLLQNDASFELLR